MIRHPRRSPLFPYTPLFRSVTWGDAASVATAGVLYVLPGALGLPHGAPSCGPCDPATLPGVDRWALRPVDRKSTRLNSSHSQISYAVFCLKKKKTYNTATTS